MKENSKLNGKGHPALFLPQKPNIKELHFAPLAEKASLTQEPCKPHKSEIKNKEQTISIPNIFRTENQTYSSDHKLHPKEKHKRRGGHSAQWMSCHLGCPPLAECGFLASAWHSPNYCGHLGSEATGGRSLCDFLSLSLPLKIK